MLTFLRRIFTVTPAVAELRERVATLESDVDWLRLDLKKLRGRVTGGARKEAAAEADGSGAPDADGSGVDRAPAGEGPGVRAVSEAVVNNRRRMRGF
jgi:hypothetical protein